MAKKLGRNCKLYYNGATYLSPSWILINVVGDVMLKGGKKEADATTRGDGGNTITVGVLKDRAIEFDMKEDTTVAVYTVLVDSYENSTGVDMLVLNGLLATSGSTGVRMTCEVFDFDRDEKLTDLITRKVSMKPTISDNYPVVYTV